MPLLPFLQVDAFTTTPFLGNPAAILLDAQYLNEWQMQTIAREMNLSETVFVMPSAVADFQLRFFTPLKEIPLAGHPTVAAVHALIEEGRLPLAGWRTQVTLQVQVGVLPVEVWTRPAMASLVVMTLQPPEFLDTYPLECVANALGILPNEIAEPVQTVSTGTPQLMVRLRDPAVLERVQPDFRALTRLTEQGDFFSVHVFSLNQKEVEEPRVCARHFAPAAGVNEDPVTGSASGAMGAYLVRYGLLGCPIFVVEQGRNVGRPGRVYVEVVMREGRIEAVRIAGEAVTVLRGVLMTEGGYARASLGYTGAS